MKRIVGQPAPLEQPVLTGRSPTSDAVSWGRIVIVLVAVCWAAAPAVGFVNALLAVTVVGYAAAFAGFGRPALGVLGVTLVCTLDPLTRHYLSNSLLRWNTFNYWLIAMAVLSIGFVWRVADPHSRVIKVLIIILAAGIIVSPDRIRGAQHVMEMCTVFGLLAYFAQAVDDADAWYVSALVSGTAGALGGLAFFLARDSLPFMNTNAWALFPEAAIFALCLGFRQAAAHPRGQLILGLLAAVNAMWAFLTGSRGGILIVSVGLLFILASTRQASHRLLALAGGALIVFLSFSTFDALGNESLRRINKLMDEEETASARTSGRSELARAGIHMVQQNPLGVGTGGFAHAWAEVGFLPGLSSFKRGEEFPAHSGWIKVLAENGWLGFLVMLVYVASFAYSGMMGRRDGSAALGWLATAGIAASFITTEFQGKAVWLLAAGVATQLNPLEMKRAMTADVERFVSRARRVVSREPTVRSASAPPTGA